MSSERAGRSEARISRDSTPSSRAQRELGSVWNGWPVVMKACIAISRGVPTQITWLTNGLPGVSGARSCAPIATKMATQ